MAASLQEYYNTGDDVGGNSLFGLTTQWQSQSFLAASSYDISSVKLKMFRIGSPGTITVSIRAAGADYLPAGEDLGSGTTDGNTLTTSSAGEWREITFGSSISLTSGNKYAICVHCSGTFALYWKADSEDNYPNGKGGISNDSGSTWGADGNSLDFMFENWGQVAVPSKPTAPTPSNTASDVTLDQETISWVNGGGATSYDVYYGTESGNLTLLESGVTDTSYTISGITNGSPFDYEKTRYWRIDAVNAGGTTTGDEWSFTTITFAVPAPGIRGYDKTGGGEGGYAGGASGDAQVNIKTRLIAFARNRVFYEDM